jgi:hypothetical protein
VAGCLGFWLLLALPARAFGVLDSALLGTLALALLCLVPAALTLLVADRLTGSPEGRLALVLGSTGFRLFIVLGVAWVLYVNVAFFHDLPGYWMWLVVFYLFTLGLEVALLVTSRARVDRQAVSGRTPEGGMQSASPHRS